MAGATPEDSTASTSTSGPKAREDVVSRQVDDEWVLYDPVSQKMHVLNTTMGMIWNHLDGTRTIDDLVRATLDAFDPTPPSDVIARDLGKVLEQLADEGLLA